MRFEAYHRRNVDIADLVAVSSEWARAQFDEFYPERKGSARVLHFCSVPTKEWWLKEPGTVAAAYGLPERFLLFSNQFTHHKNHETVFEAVRILKSRGVDVTVVCTGSTWGFRGDDYHKTLMEFRARHGLEGHIRVLGMIPREAQVALLRRAIAVLQPSHVEGWATAVEDARTLGKTLLVSSIPVHREQLGDTYAGLIEPSDAECWAACMERAWATGRAGPIVEEEARALGRHREDALAVGRTFVGILREAAGRGHG